MIDLGSITIGPLRFRLRSESLSAVRYAEWPYGAFFRPPQDIDASPTVHTEMTVNVHEQARMIPTGTPLFSAGRNWAVWAEGADRIFCSGFHQRDTARAYCRVTESLEQADLFVDGDAGDAPLRYPLDQILSWGLLSRVGGLLMHAAVAEKDGWAWIFAGRSGAGKSTLSSFCAAAGWTILNDDRVILYPDNGTWMAAGTPWHGSGKYAEARIRPVRAIAMLQQHYSNQLMDVSATEARLGLLDVAAVPWFEESWSSSALNALNALTESVTCRRLRFTRSPEAVTVLETDLYQKA